MSLILLGFISSLLTEFVNWINKQFTGTVLEGRGAFILSLGVSFAAGFYKVWTTTGFNLESWASIVTTFGAVYVFAQIFFDYFIKKFGLKVE